MLEVLACRPVAAPFESCLGEEAEAEVTVVYLVWEVPRTVAVDAGCGGLDEACAIRAVFIIRIVEGVDVDGQATGVFRQRTTARDGTITEA